MTLGFRTKFFITLVVVAAIDAGHEGDGRPQSRSRLPSLPSSLALSSFRPCSNNTWTPTSAAVDVSVRELGNRIDELLRDRARLDAILAGMVEGVLVLDGHGRLQMANRAAQRMLRMDTSSIGRPYVEVIRHPDIAAQLGTALRGEEADNRELALTRDPSRTFVSRAAPVTRGGGGGAVLVLHDITDLRRADQIRRDFVANVSHELRTPLTAIRGYVEALLDDEPDVTDTRKFLEIIARHSARMERLVSDLLRLARLDARQEALDLASCDMQQLFNTVVGDVALTVESKRQHITTAVDPAAGRITADPGKLHDVLRNLVENAVHYSPEAAAIQLEATHDERHDPHLCFRFGPRHSARRSVTRLRTLLSRRQVAIAPGWDRARSRHREAPHRAARRPGARREQAGRWCAVRDHPSGPALSPPEVLVASPATPKPRLVKLTITTAAVHGRPDVAD